MVKGRVSGGGGTESRENMKRKGTKIRQRRSGRGNEKYRRKGTEQKTAGMNRNKGREKGGMSGRNKRVKGIKS